MLANSIYVTENDTILILISTVLDFKELSAHIRYILQKLQRSFPTVQCTYSGPTLTL